MPPTLKASPLRRGLVAAAFVLAAIALIIGGMALLERPISSAPASPPPVAVNAKATGSGACASCHAAEHAAWRKNQHARAMQHATPETVLGDFKSAKFSYAGVTSTFTTREGRFFVRTDGPDGKLADFEIKYTFGLEPLQQ